jgi:hypothetical protein
MSGGEDRSEKLEARSQKNTLTVYENTFEVG